MEFPHQQGAIVERFFLLLCLALSLCLRVFVCFLHAINPHLPDAILDI
jgi:hypothetical protein